MVRRVWFFLSLSVVACAHSSDANVDASERALAANEATYARSAEGATRIRLMASDLVDQTKRVATTLDAASAAWTDAAARYGEATTQYKEAAKAYANSEAWYRWIAYGLIAAATSDVLIGSVCGPRVSTAAYRRQLEARGVDLKGIDIDHIVAHANGGPDRPWNYNPLPASINRSLQDGGLLWKLQNFPLETVRALVGFALYTIACHV